MEEQYNEIIDKFEKTRRREEIAEEVYFKYNAVGSDREHEVYARG